MGFRLYFALDIGLEPFFCLSMRDAWKWDNMELEVNDS